MKSLRRVNVIFGRSHHHVAICATYVCVCMLFRSNRDIAAAYRKHERETKKKQHAYEQHVCEVELTLLVLLSASGDPEATIFYKRLSPLFNNLLCFSTILYMYWTLYYYC